LQWNESGEADILRVKSTVQKTWQCH